VSSSASAPPGARQRLAATAFGDGSVGRYAVIGLSGVALDMLLFVLLTRAGAQPVPATVLSTLAGIGNNYVLNARYNFRSGVTAVGARRFLTVGLLGLAVAALSLEGLLQLGLSPLLAKLVSLPFVLVAQFLANKHWTFRP
jgi:dolichol-phosphate mannosyltransferase